MSAPAKLELRRISRHFGAQRAVATLSLEVRQGEFVSLLGPSGCGKSTTLGMVAGFVAPDEGEILVDGCVVNNVPPQRRRIGLVFQDYAVFSGLSVAANLAFGLAARGVPYRERRRAVAAIAEKLELAPLLGRRGGTLNMSEMQRVALARVLVTEPELLLLDEPMSNLDAHDRARLRGELKLVQKQLGQTVLYVTHDQAEAMSLSDRIAVMEDGALRQIGTPEEIYRRPRSRFVAEFIGEPPINLIPCEVRAERGGLVIATTGQRGLALSPGIAAPGAYVLGIRPHDIRAARAAEGDPGACPIRFVENLGAEHVLHIEYGAHLVRVVAPRGFAAMGDAVHLDLMLPRAHLIPAAGDVVLSLAALEIAA